MKEYLYETLKRLHQSEIYTGLDTGPDWSLIGPNNLKVRLELGGMTLGLKLETNYILKLLSKNALDTRQPA